MEDRTPLVALKSVSEVLAQPFATRDPWKKITCGLSQDKEILCQTLIDHGHKLDHWGKVLIANDEFTLLSELLGQPIEIELYLATVKEFTGKEYTVSTEVYAGRDQHGFCDCPDETALILRDGYVEQPMDEHLTVMSKPRAGIRGWPFVLQVAHRSDGSWVFGKHAHPGSAPWYNNEILVVCRRLKTIL